MYQDGCKASCIWKSITNWCVAFQIATFVSVLSSPVHADDFYKGKTVTLISSGGTSGIYSDIARLFLRFFPNHLPGHPNTIFSSMPGGGNVLATNYMYNLAPKDGTYIAVFNNAVPMHQVLDGRGVRYDARRFNWLGSSGALNSVMYVWYTSGIKKITDAMKREVVLGGTGAGSDIVYYPMVMNDLLGTKFKVVMGYKNVSEIDLAVTRGEVQGRIGSYKGFVVENSDWVKEGKMNFIVQFGTKRDTAIPNVPLMTELAKNDEQRQILTLLSSPIALGRPYVAPPDLPADRLALLRKAFTDTMKDKAFIASASKLNVDINLITGDEIAKVVNDIVNTPPEIVTKAKAAMGPAAASGGD